MPKKTLGQKIREFRKSSKLTQQQLALRLGVDNTTVSKWEADIYQPDTDKLDSLANLFNVTVDELMDRQTDEIQRNENPLDDPEVQFIMRAKKDLTPKQFEKMMELARKAKEMFQDEEDDD